MKTTTNNLPRIDTLGEKNKDLGFDNEELLYKMPAVVLLVLLPGVFGQPMQLYYANRALALHTHHDPKVLKEPGCDFFNRLLFAVDRCIMEKTLDHLLRNPDKGFFCSDFLAGPHLFVLNGEHSAPRAGRGDITNHYFLCIIFLCSLFSVF